MTTSMLSSRSAWVANFLPSRTALKAASIALDFFTYGIGGVLIESSRNGRTDPEVLTDQLYRLLSGQMVQMPLE